MEIDEIERIYPRFTGRTNSMAVDITGQRFGRLTALYRTTNIGGNVRWVCKCDCGTICCVIKGGLKNGHSSSCGCYNLEQTRKANSTHRMTHSKTYREWNGIKTRCCNLNNPKYPTYGGRGISMCDRWKNSFDDFYSDVSVLPHFGEDGYSIDRYPDKNGNYEPGNVRWATDREQANNRRSNKMVEYNGEIHNIKTWSEIKNVPYNVLYDRIRLGWSVERALTTPIRKSKR